ncbi:MAG: trimethylamine methyltransferase family protein [Anaerolineales bacterium]|nr:trimethylamine methyltransferase family protein [Chloroflexota bacterium]MBL6981064.1 trimethylamine methyltransferase family protein [Anaerolineales bacterium]
MNLSKLNHWCEFLSATDIQAIHDTSMKLLSEIGIRFPNKEALTVFEKHGAKIDGQTVYLTESQVMNSIESIPDQFTISARNPDRNVIIGDGTPVFAPGLGAPFLIDQDVGKRSATMDDYRDLVRLAQALPNQDMSGHQMAMPGDIPPRVAHLAMVHTGIVYSDKPFIGSTDGTEGANHTLELAKILFGGALSQPVTVGVINPLSPLGYSPDMIEALMIYAKAGQPLLISTLIMAGSTGPITLAGVLAQQNAEILAGIILAQLIKPGTPIIYGSTSTNTDMRTGALSIGGPELSLCISAHTQLARFYGLPSRGGGALTDSNTTDAQAGLESMFSLLTTINSGIDFVLHSAGILSSYMAFSREKFVLDDEMIGMLKKFMQGIKVSPETLGYDVIANVGQNGHFLEEDHTLERCQSEFWQPDVVNRLDLATWMSNGKEDAAARAKRRWIDILGNHQDPHLENLIIRQLQAYVDEKTLAL